MSEIIETPDDARFHQEDLQQSDWVRLRITLGIIESRGIPVRLERPAGWSKKADFKLTMRNALMRQLDTILTCAIVDEPEEPDA